jgi:hypothetical protein
MMPGIVSSAPNDPNPADLRPPSAVRTLRRSRARGGLACACLAALAACGTPLAYDPAAPILATLPAAAAGIRDDRARFDAYFERELEAAPPAAPDAAASAPRPGLAAFVHEPASAPPLADRVAALPPLAPAGDLSRVAVLIVPGLFGDCVDTQSVPFGDGLVRSSAESYTAAYGLYADLGLADLRALRIPGRADSAHNGGLIAQELNAESARPDVDTIVLVAYSKGAPDALHALHALQAEGGVPAKVKALVTVSGVVMGTPIADAHASLYDSLSGMMALGGCPPSEGGEIESLARRVRAPWLAKALPLPPMGYYSLVAHAPHDEMSSGLSGFNDDLSKIDPRNDGQVIESDAILPFSTLIGEVRSDHWTYVLPLAQHPKLLVRGFASDSPFPRAALFRAVVRYVADDLARPQR